MAVVPESWSSKAARWHCELVSMKASVYNFWISSTDMEKISLFAALIESCKICGSLCLAKMEQVSPNEPCPSKTPKNAADSSPQNFLTPPLESWLALLSSASGGRGGRGGGRGLDGDANNQPGVGCVIISEDPSQSQQPAISPRGGVKSQITILYHSNEESTTSRFLPLTTQITYDLGSNPSD